MEIAEPTPNQPCPPVVKDGIQGRAVADTGARPAATNSHFLLKDDQRAELLNRSPIDRQATLEFEKIYAQFRCQMTLDEASLFRTLVGDLRTNPTTKTDLYKHRLYLRCVLHRSLDLTWVPWLAMRLLYFDSRDSTDPIRKKFRTCPVTRMARERFEGSGIDIFVDKWPEIRPPRPQSWGPLLGPSVQTAAKPRRAMGLGKAPKPSSHAGSEGKLRQSGEPSARGSQGLQRLQASMSSDRPSRARGRPNYRVETLFPDESVFELVLSRSSSPAGESRVSDSASVRAYSHAVEEVVGEVLREEIKQESPKREDEEPPNLVGEQHPTDDKLEEEKQILQRDNDDLQREIRNLQERIRGLEQKTEGTQRPLHATTSQYMNHGVQADSDLGMTIQPAGTQPQPELIRPLSRTLHGAVPWDSPGPCGAPVPGSFSSVLFRNTVNGFSGTTPAPDDRVFSMITRHVQALFNNLYGPEFDLRSFVTQENMDILTKSIQERLTRLEERNFQSNNPLTSEQIMDLLDPKPE